MTYCETCNDSGEVEAKVQHQDRPTEHVMCLACPRCLVCDTLISQAAGPGKIGDEWVCSPEHGALVFTGNIDPMYAEPKELLEAAHCLEIMGRSLETKERIRDYKLLSRVIARLAMGQTDRADFLNGALREARGCRGISDIPEFLQSIVRQGGAS